jgi:indole-3-glycerol phosphate synthase
MKIIGEAKPKSPFGWRSPYSWDELFEIANEVSDIVAVHTGSPWGGSFDLLEKARSLTDKPLLAKGIHTTDEEVIEAVRHGADLVLTFGKLVSVHLDLCLIEPTSFDELGSIPDDRMVVWNSRDLSTGGLKSESFDQARESFSGFLVHASNIAGLKDIDPRADAALIGTHLPSVANELRQLTPSDRRLL